tara:strand:- start:165 stop:395 length:231 start_codon:yes stop_codon:yes gene_type:complete
MEYLIEKYLVGEDSTIYVASVYGCKIYGYSYIVRSKGNTDKVAVRNGRDEPYWYGWRTKADAEEAIRKHKKQFATK